MIQLGEFASTMVYRFQFLNYLHALVQYQHQEIINKEKLQVKYKNREQLYSAGLQKRLLEGQGKMVTFNNVPQVHEGKAQRDQPRKTLSCALQSPALSCSLPCFLEEQT